MSESVVRGAPRARTPVHLWIVGVLALLWSLMGVVDYLATQTQWQPYMAAFTPEQLDYFYGFPVWMVAAWAFAVWCGFAGTLGLLLRRRWAVWMYAVSLAGLAISTVYQYVFTDAASILGRVAAIFTVVIWAVAIFLLLYARAMAKRGVLV